MRAYCTQFLNCYLWIVFSEKLWDCFCLLIVAIVIVPDHHYFYKKLFHCTKCNKTLRKSTFGYLILKCFWLPQLLTKIALLHFEPKTKEGREKQNKWSAIQKKQERYFYHEFYSSLHNAGECPLLKMHIDLVGRYRYIYACWEFPVCEWTLKSFDKIWIFFTNYRKK